MYGKTKVHLVVPLILTSSHIRSSTQGDLVQLKEISMLVGTELKTKAMDLLVMSHGLRHENINPFIGE